MKVAVLEYLSGGGLSDEQVPNSLRQEGMSMLCALANDLILCGHEVQTCLDKEASKLSDSLVDEVRIHELGTLDVSWLDRWDAIAISCDRTIVIAPELGHQLEHIVERLRAFGSTVVASSKDFLRAASDKRITADLLSKASVAHPSTCTLSQFLANSTSYSSLKPLTVKRRDGAGCAEMKYFGNAELLKHWLAKPTWLNLNGDEWIVQPWLSGRPASMAIIGGDHWRVLGAVEQFIELAPCSEEHGFANVSYLGGAGPLSGVSLEQLQELAQRVRQAFPAGANGWIGIDFLVSTDPEGNQEFVVIEVNPRLTTSYLGYRKWYGHRLANACVEPTGSFLATYPSNSVPPLLERSEW